MSLPRRLLSLAAVVGLAWPALLGVDLAGTSAANGLPSVPAAGSAASATTSIRHIVVIVMENHGLPLDRRVAERPVPQFADSALRPGHQLHRRRASVAAQLPRALQRLDPGRRGRRRPHLHRQDPRRPARSPRPNLASCCRERPARLLHGRCQPRWGRWARGGTPASTSRRSASRASPTTRNAAPT